jgi:hypothetical protein
MATRQIKYYACGLAAKYVPWHDDYLKINVFPHPTSVNTDGGAELLRKISVLPPSYQQAILQQYNEILLWKQVDLVDQKIIAPIVDIKTNEPHCPPTIVLPIFTPLMKRDEVWKYNERELNMLVGMFAAKHHISDSDLIGFYGDVIAFCETYDLQSDDILRNPSNIGYHASLGLRLIDYGLSKNNKLLTY